MIELKSAREIERMRAAGALVAQALARIAEIVAPGVTTGELDAAATAVVTAGGGRMAFRGQRSGSLSYPANICASVNEEVVHGIPGPRRLVEGDIVSVDVGVILDGFYGDAAATLPVGAIDAASERLVATTRECLARAIEAARPGRKLSDIARAVEQLAVGRGYGVVRDYVGHGIGRTLWEEPRIPNFVSRELLANDVVLAPGMTLALEPMVNVGGWAVRTQSNGWTVVTRDGRRSAHFEHTVALMDGETLVLTRAI